MTINNLINDEIFPLGKMNEGGRAIHGKRILLEDIEPTLAHFEEKVLMPILNIGVIDCKLLGSTGLKPESGDIDIGIPYTVACEKEDVFFHHYPMYLKGMYEKINKVCPGSILNLVFNQIHTKVPLVTAGNVVTKDFVQIDMIFGNLNYLTWSMSSFPDKSTYASWTRNALLAALGRTRIIQESADMKVIYRTRLSYNTVSGILSKIEYRFKNDPKNISNADHLLNIELLSSNPDTVAQLLFNNNKITADMLTTGEEVVTQIKMGITAGDIDEDRFLQEFDNITTENQKDLPEISAILGTI
jgi:hypothetical protein